MTRFLKQLMVGEEGATMVEYALMIALIAAALIGTVRTLALALTVKFAATTGAVNGAS